MKILVMPSSIDEINKTLNYCDAYLIGINGLSVNNSLSVDIDDLDNICNIIGNKELFINLNKNMSNNDIKELESVMIMLNNYNIKGVFYYDVAVINIYNKNKYNYDLVWASEHATTNYNTINYWYDIGVNYCLVSSDITVNEIIDIKKNSECKLVVPIFGYQPMFNSKRHIVKNYLEYFKLNDNSSVNYMEKEGKIYPIIDDENGTEVYTNYILNGILEFNKLKDSNIEYVLFNGFNIDKIKFIDILKLVNSIDNNNCLEISDRINGMFDNIGCGFFYTETIAKVKKDAK